MPFVESQKFVDKAINFGKCVIKVWGLFLQERNKDGCVIMEGLRLYLIKKLFKIFVGP